MSETLLNPTVIANEALMQLENNLVMGGLVHRDYKPEFVKIGDTVTIRRPVKFTATNGASFTQQDVIEGSTSITIDKRKHVGWGFSTQDLTLTIEEYSERYIKPAAIALANKVDEDLCLLYKDVWHIVGTPGQIINSYADFAKIPERMDEMAVPQDMRRCVMSPTDRWALAGSQTGLFMDKIVGPAYRQGTIGRIGNIDTYQDQNIQTHTTGFGIQAGTTDLNAANQDVTYASVRTTYEQSLITDGWTNPSSIKQGDVFTIAGVFAVNPVSKATLPFLQPFVVKATVASTGSATLTISPPIIASGPYQTVSAVPANGADLTMLTGSDSTGYRQNLAFHKNAFALVMVPLEMPDSAGWTSRASDPQTKLSIRVIKDYDFQNDREQIRLDVMYGVKAIYPDLAVRAFGTA